MAQPTNAREPDVSVVVVNYRSAALTLRALEAAEQSAAGLRLEEIVVDNASGQEEVKLLETERPQASVVALHANRGFAAGNNAGISRARGRHLLLVNPDAFAQGDAVVRLVEYLDAHPAVAVAAPLLRNPDGTHQDNSYRRFPNLLTLFVDYCAPLAFAIRGTRLDPHHTRRRETDRCRQIAHAVGAALLVRAEAAVAAGPLDEGYFLYLEETEWQRRMAAAGWGIHLVPNAVFVHLGGGSSSSYPLSSPAFLDSIERYYSRPRLAMAVVRVASLISLATLRIAHLLLPRQARVEYLERAFSQLRPELKQRRRR